MTDDESSKSPVVPSKRKGNAPARAGNRTKKDEADKEYERIAYGSVKDPTPRKRLNVKRLDLDWTYVGGELAPQVEGQWPVPEKPAKKRWQHHDPEPLTDYSLVPDDWSAYDDDLDAEYVLPFPRFSGRKRPSIDSVKGPRRSDRAMQGENHR